MTPDAEFSLEHLLAQRSWLRRLAFGLMRDPDAAEDILQDTLLAAIERPPAPNRPVANWLVRVMRNAAGKRRRADVRRRDREAVVAADRAGSTFGDLEQRVALQEEIARAVLALDEPYRRTVILHYFEEQSVNQIATLMSLSQPAVRQRLKRGRDRLRAHLDAGVKDSSSRGVAWRAVAGSWLTPEKAPVAWLAWVLPIGAGLAIAALFLVTQQSGGSAAAVLPATRLAPSDPGAEAGPPGRDSALVVERARKSEPDSRAHTGQRFGILRVEVRDEQGRPAGDEVVLLQRPAPDSPYPWQRSLRTDARGHATLKDLAPGPLSVGLLRRGDAMDNARIRSGKESRLELSLPAGFELHRIVRDANGYAVPRAELWVGEPWSRVRGHVLAVADNKGRYRLPGLQPNGMHWVGALAQGFAPTPVLYFDANPGDRLEHDFVLPEAGGALHGVVVSAEGEALAGVEVQIGHESPLWACSRGGSPPRYTITDTDGAFQFDGLAAGPHPVRARVADHAPAEVEVDVVLGRESRTELRFQAGATVSGRVLDASGIPQVDTRVSIVGSSAFASSRAWSDEEGRFVLPSLPAGSVTLQAHRRGVGRTRASLVLVAGEDHAWNPALLPEPRLFGVLLDASGRPVPKRELATWHGGTARRGTQYSFTDDEGRFSFTVEEGDDHRLVVYGVAGSFPTLALDRLSPGLDPLELRLAEEELHAGRLTGRLIGPEGEALEAGRLTIHHQSLDLSHLLRVPADGQFDLPLPAGRLSLQVEAQGAAPLQAGTFELRAGEVLDLGAIDLLRPALVRGSILGVPTSSRSSLRLRWMRTGDELGRSQPTRDTYQSPPLPPGETTLVLQGDGIERLALQFSLEEGVELQRDLRPRIVPMRRVRLDLAPGLPRPEFIEAHLEGSDGQLAWEHAASAAPEGPLELRISAAPGRYRLHVTCDVGTSIEADFEIEMGSAPLQLSLQQ